jgi:hypothetical protein
MWESILKISTENAIADAKRFGGDDANQDKATIRMLEEKIDELVDNISSIDSYHNAMETLLEKGTKQYKLWEGMIPPLQLVRITLEELDKYDFAKLQEKRKIIDRAYNISKE